MYPSSYPPRTDWPGISNRLAVEVLSRSSRMYDREFKRDAYLALGVNEVWLVNWREAEVEVCSAPRVSRLEREAFDWRTPADVLVRLDLAEVFKGV